MFNLSEKDLKKIQDRFNLESTDDVIEHLNQLKQELSTVDGIIQILVDLDILIIPITD